MVGELTCLRHSKFAIPPLPFTQKCEGLNGLFAHTEHRAYQLWRVEKPGANSK